MKFIEEWDLGVSKPELRVGWRDLDESSFFGAIPRDSTLVDGHRNQGIMECGGGMWMYLGCCWASGFRVRTEVC